jgi:hypothetical protein
MRDYSFGLPCACNCQASYKHHVVGCWFATGVYERLKLGVELAGGPPAKPWRIISSGGGQVDRVDYPYGSSPRGIRRVSYPLGGGRTGVCRRHPRACQHGVLPSPPANRTRGMPPPSFAAAATADVAYGHVGVPLATVPAAVHALSGLAGTWCQVRDGCIASSWRAETLTPLQRG